MRCVLVNVIVAITLTLTDACWFYSKEDSVKKIKILMEKEQLSMVSKSYIQDLTASLPAPVQWVINSFGVDTAFKDCDANGDDAISLTEIESTTTCLDTCTKMYVLNTAIRI